MKRKNISKLGQQMKFSSFNLFLDQQERFIKTLRDYDPNIWFPPLRGGFKENNPGNWFICFVPASWGHWKGAIYGVHFDFMYARPRGSLSERIRLAVGVETPMVGSQRQSFKEVVISRVKEKGIAISDFVLQAKVRTKLLESDQIPFNDRSWQVAFQRYITLQPLVETIAIVVKEYYNSGAFRVPMVFQG